MDHYGTYLYIYIYTYATTGCYWYLLVKSGEYMDAHGHPYMKGYT